MGYGRFGDRPLDDDQPIGFWMDDQADQTAQRDAFDAAGRDRWNASTRSGENLDASRPTDVVALGGGPGSSSAPAGVDADPVADRAQGDQSTAAPSAASSPSVRYVKAQAGDNVTRLVGGSDPAAIGAFARLNGMDGRSSTIYAGRDYRIPSEGDATADDAALGAAILQHDNARVAALRAQQRANDQFLPRSNAGESVWPGQLVGTPAPTAAPQTQPWWNSGAAKVAAGSVAYGLGALVAGAPTAVYHSVGDVKDAGLFGLQWAGALGPQAQARASQEAADAARGALRYGQAAINDPSRVVADVRDATGRAIENISPFNADLSGSVWDVTKHQFQHGQNFGEAATNVAGLFAGGELVQGLRAAKAFEATKAARITKLVEQGANPKLAEYLAQPYEGMGHHSIISRKLANDLNLPSWLVDNPINVAKPRGMSRNDFYKYHYQVDPKAGGFRLPADLNGGKGWRPKELGLTKYSPPERIWKGIPVPLKDAMTTIPFADAPTLYGQLDTPQ